MSIVTIELRDAHAQHVRLTDDSLSVDLTDGRTTTVPLAWYPRLLWGTPRERNNWRLISEGEGIHWPDLDEDLSVENPLSGKPCGESQASFRRWVESRKVRNKQKRMYRRRG